jgi:hypothetical protein
MNRPLGEDLRRLFEREIGVPPRGVRERVLSGVSQATPRTRRWHSAASLVALFLAAAIIVTLLVARENQRVVPGNQQLTPSPSPATPSDLIWVQDGNNPAQYDVIDWSGRSVSTFSMAGGHLVTPAFDGQSAMVDGSKVVGWNGNALGSLNVPDSDLLDAAWADDNRHVCVIAQPPGHGPNQGLGRLWLAQAGSPARLIRKVGQAGSAPAVLACSMVSNRAVIASELNAHIPDPQGDRQLITLLVQVIDLTTGAVVTEHHYGAAASVALFVVASPDGRYLAEDRISGPVSGGSAIKEITTGRLMATFQHASVVGFSWDGGRVNLHFSDATTDETRVVDVVGGSTVWSHGGPVAIEFRPRTLDFVAALDDPAGDYDLLFVPQVGSARVIARQVFVSSWCGCVGPRA